MSHTRRYRNDESIHSSKSTRSERSSKKDLSFSAREQAAQEELNGTISDEELSYCEFFSSVCGNLTDG
jgi:hypothetical protein